MSLTNHLDPTTVERALRTLADLHNTYGVRELDQHHVLVASQHEAAERAATALNAEMDGQIEDLNTESPVSSSARSVADHLQAACNELPILSDTMTAVRTVSRDVSALRHEIEPGALHNRTRLRPKRIDFVYRSTLVTSWWLDDVVIWSVELDALGNELAPALEMERICISPGTLWWQRAAPDWLKEMAAAHPRPGSPL